MRVKRWLRGPGLDGEAQVEFQSDGAKYVKGHPERDRFLSELTRRISEELECQEGVTVLAPGVFMFEGHI